MRLFLLCLMISGAFRSFAQGYGASGLTLPNKYFTLRPFELWHKQSWKDSVYRFPQFQEARLVFDTGFSPPQRLKMNYNVYLETMDVLTDKNETWVMKKFPTLKFIWIGEHKFYYDRSIGYLEVILNGKISVATQHIMVSAIEYSNGARAAQTGPDVRTNSSAATRYYWPIEYYYVLDPENKAHKPTPMLLSSMLPTMKDRIRDFAVINETNYRDREDLLKIVKFCNDNIEADTALSASLTIPARSTLRQSEWRDSLYRFKSFQEASVTYEDGTRRTRMMNYNLVKRHLEVIAGPDTIKVIGNDGVKLVNVDGVTFLNNGTHGPLEVIMQGKVALGLQKSIVFDGEYNAQLDSLVGTTDLPREKIYHIENSWFFITGSKVVPANARTLLGLFRPHKKEISTYISTNNVDFRLREDLLKVLSYCARF